MNDRVYNVQWKILELKENIKKNNDMEMRFRLL